MESSHNSPELRAEQSVAREMPGSSFCSNTFDLSGQVNSWLGSAIELAESASEEIAVELKAVDRAWRSPSFRIAFVGEFSRGKSTLINRLLGQKILPTGVLPTTATPTFIRSGSVDQMEVLFSDSRREMRLLEKASWADLIAFDQEVAEQEPSAQVQLTLNHSWLHEIDVELVDAPGAGDLSGRRAAFISQLLAQCDATVLVVSATIPFSTAEAVFLEQEVIGRHIPRILVVVSKLDTIPYDQRVDVFNSIQNRVAQISADASVLPLHPIDATHTENQILEMVKVQMVAMVSKESRRAWRSQRIAEQIIDSLDHLIEVAKIAISTIKKSAAERTKALQEAQAEIRKAEIDWERIRLELDQRRLEYDKKLRADINAAKLDLLEVLLMELKRNPDPKSWWERDLPFHLRRKLPNFARNFENIVINNIASDFELLKAEIAKTFAIKLANKPINSIASNEVKPELGQFELTDIQKQRFWARVGSGASLAANSIVGSASTLVLGAAAAAFAIPITLIGVSASVGVGILVDQRMQESVNKQRDLLAQELETTLDQSIEQFSSILSKNLRQLYLQLLEQIQQGQKTWQAAKESAFKADNHLAKEKVCQEIILQATSLKEEVVEALNADES